MLNNSVVIASTAGFLADMLSEKLSEINYKVYVAGNDKELFIRINNYFPRLIFIEHCFCNNVTDEYVHKIKRNNQNLRIVIWTATEISPFSAARFINAGAESFITLRETGEILHKILNRILLGETYCPDEVEDACKSENTIPIFEIPLTARDKKILKLLHRRDFEIANELCISINTIHYHKKKLFKKIGVKNRIAAINWAIKQGIILPEKIKYKD